MGELVGDLLHRAAVVAEQLDDGGGWGGERLEGITGRDGRVHRTGSHRRTGVTVVRSRSGRHEPP
jgi:hypothetical protein